MKTERLILISFLVIILQSTLLNILDLSQFVSLMFIPAIILCLPLTVSTSALLVISFAMGFLVDFCSSGTLGLTICALLPTALAKREVVKLVCGEEVFSRGENISLERQGIVKIAVSLLILTAIFLLVYIWADGAGTRPFWFNIVRFLSSLIVSTLAGLAVVNVFSESR